MEKELENRLEKKQLEVNALLELTKAIQNNFAESKLYQIFTFTLLGTDTVQRFALYIKEEGNWVRRLYHGVQNAKPLYILPLDLALKQKMVEISKQPEAFIGFEEFELSIPVTHKSEVLAYLLLGGLNIENPEAIHKLAFINAFTNVLVVALENKRLVRSQIQQESLKRELEIAKAVQQNLFPDQLPNTASLKVEAFYLPHQSVGGDYYDFMDLGERKHLLAIADVSGKGIPASLLMSNFHASLQTLVRQSTNLYHIVRELNHLVGLSGKGEYFITAFLAIINQNSQTIEYINSGHNPPLFFQDHDSNTRLLDIGSTVLGVFPELPELETGRLKYENQCFLFAYTDGLTELRNNLGEELGETKLTDLLIDCYNSGQHMCGEHLRNLIEDHRKSEPYLDDVTYISCYLN